MIQSDKGWNIKLGSWIFLGNLALWSLQAIVQIIRNGALSAPVIQSVGFAFFVFRHSVRDVHGRGQPDPVYGVVLSSLLPLPVVARMIIMGLC